MFLGLIFLIVVKYLILPTMVKDLPLPAPAITRLFISSVRMAFFWFLSNEWLLILLNSSRFRLSFINCLLCFITYLSKCL